jgi:hypothetical protein
MFVHENLVHFQWNLMTRQSRAISYAVLYMNLHESMTQFPKGKIATDVYTIDIVIALLNTVCFVNISIPKAKAQRQTYL